jgi:hypothetical protein
MTNWHYFFEYRAGDLYWKVDRGRRKVKGLRVGQVNNKGYRIARIEGKTVLVHRIIFFLFHGYVPTVVDHVDGDPSNNRIENLRECTHAQNQYNRKIDARNKTGVKNVYWHGRDRLWVVRMKLSGKVRQFGCYKDIDLAELVAIEARNKYHGEFARHR